MILDTIPHIIDTTNRVVNIINPGKVWHENIVSYIALFVSIGSLIATIIYNRKQIKNSYNLLIKSNRINIELKELDSFKETRIKLIILMGDSVVLRMESKPKEVESKIIEIYKLHTLFVEYPKKYKIEYSTINIADFTNRISQPYMDKQNHYIDLENENKINQLFIEFIKETETIINEQQNKILSE